MKVSVLFRGVLCGRGHARKACGKGSGNADDGRDGVNVGDLSGHILELAVS